MSNPAASDDEIKAASDVLAKLQPGFLPIDIFLQLCRLSVNSVVEIVPLRIRGNTVEVLLTERPANDPYFAHMLHTPGTVVRPTDASGGYDDAFRRILNGELQSVAVTSKPRYVMSLLHKSRRGMEDAKVFFVEVAGEPTIGAFHDVNNLPANVIETQLAFIRTAAQAFLREREETAATSASV